MRYTRKNRYGRRVISHAALFAPGQVVRVVLQDPTKRWEMGTELTVRTTLAVHSGASVAYRYRLTDHSGRMGERSDWYDESALEGIR